MNPEFKRPLPNNFNINGNNMDSMNLFKHIPLNSSLLENMNMGKKIDNR